MMSFFAVELRRATDVAIVTVSNPALHGHICSVLLDRREGGGILSEGALSDEDRTRKWNLAYESQAGRICNIY